MTGHWRYLLVERGPIYDALVDWKARRIAAHAAMMEFAKARGADGFGINFDGAMWAISYVRPIPTGWKIGGRRKDKLQPAKTPEGKDEAAKMKALTPIPRAKEIADLIGMPSSYGWKSANGRGFDSYIDYQTEPLQVGWAGDTFCMLVPDHDAVLAEFYEREPEATVDTECVWTVPAGLTPISKARWDLIMATHEVAQEEAKAKAQKAVA